MPDLASIGGGPRRAGQASQLRVRVVRAPMTSTDPLEVVALNYSNAYSFEVPAGAWAPRGAALPTVGLTGLLVLDDYGDAWLVAWAP